MECILKPEGVNCGELGQGLVLLFLVFGIENAESETGSRRLKAQYGVAIYMEMGLCCQSDGSVTHPALRPVPQLLQISVHRIFDVL